MIYYQSKELADLLGINLARWKRWVREFLPPDPLGGLQSGYARQFSLQKAFRVFLGGQLVSTLKFTIPEAIRILDDLDAWLKANGFYTFNARRPHLSERSCGCRVYVFSSNNGRFGYAIRRMHAGGNELAKNSTVERFECTLLHTDVDPLAQGCLTAARVIGISAFYLLFLEKLESKSL